MSTAEVSDGPSWYVVRTGSKQEQRAMNNLSTMSIEGFLPMVKIPRVNSFTGITTHVPGPMFPCYAFAHFESDRSLHQVCYTRGVRGVVSFGGVLARVEDSIITIMRSQIDEDGFVRLGAELKAGDHVQVNCGHLANFAGVFEHGINGSDRVAILLTAVSYQARIVIEKKFVERVNSDRTRAGRCPLGASVLSQN